MSDEAGPEVKRKKKNWLLEMRFNLVLAIVSLIVTVAGAVMGNGIIFGIGFFLLIFFCVYTIYGYVNKKLDLW
jgi:hypothetical protein